MTLPLFLADNRATDSGAVNSYTGTEVVGFPLVSARDWFDYTLFQVDELTTDWRIVMAADATSDCFAFYVDLPDDVGSATYEIKILDDALAEQATYTLLPNEPIRMIEFTQFATADTKSLYVRFVIPGGASLKVRSLAVGNKMIPAIGQHSGIKPPTLSGGYVFTNAMSVNGSFLARDVIRRLKKGSADFSPVTQDWVRAVWEPFAALALRHSLFYSWNQDDRPEEAVFSIAKTIMDPSNIMPPGFMSVSLPLESINK